MPLLHKLVVIGWCWACWFLTSIIGVVVWDCAGIGVGHWAVRVLSVRVFRILADAFFLPWLLVLVHESKSRVLLTTNYHLYNLLLGLLLLLLLLLLGIQFNTPIKKINRFFFWKLEILLGHYKWSLIERIICLLL